MNLSSNPRHASNMRCISAAAVLVSNVRRMSKSNTILAVALKSRTRSCSAQVALCKLLCASCAVQAALCLSKLLFAIVLCKSFCASCSAQLPCAKLQRFRLKYSQTADFQCQSSTRNRSRSPSSKSQLLSTKEHSALSEPRAEAACNAEGCNPVAKTPTRSTRSYPSLAADAVTLQKEQLAPSHVALRKLVSASCFVQVSLRKQPCGDCELVLCAVHAQVTLCKLSFSHVLLVGGMEL